MTNELKKIILKKLDENYGKDLTITKLCDDIVLEEQKQMIKNPKIYMSATKNWHKKEQVFLMAKCNFPIGVNKTKEIRVYLGRIEQYPNGIKDTFGMLSAKRKILKKIEREYPQLF